VQGPESRLPFQPNLCKGKIGRTPFRTANLEFVDGQADDHKVTRNSVRVARF
jgi:hypothetical protein